MLKQNFYTTIFAPILELFTRIYQKQRFNWNVSKNDCRVNLWIFWDILKGQDLKPYPLGGGEYSWKFLMEVCHPVLQILILLQTKKCNFPHPFSDQTSKIRTRFLTSSLERKQKNSSNAFQIRIFPFLSYSFGIDTINTFIHSRSSLKNFRPNRHKNHSRYWGSTPPPPEALLANNW